jgi:DNA-binding beta-propeller fold protein YncE
MHPDGVALDPATGTMYIADSNANTIRAVSPAGVISTVAGAYGSACPASIDPCGDGGPAKLAQLYQPMGIAYSAAARKLYIADRADNRVRVIDAAGTISTLAGNGTGCANTTAPCGDGGSAAAGNLKLPYDVAVGPAGSVIIADTYDNRIRRVDAHGTITTIAGTGGQCLSPTVNPACGDGSAATVATFAFPDGVAVSPAGDVFVADSGDQRVRKISASTHVITTIAGNGTACTPPTDCGDGTPAVTSELAAPSGVALAPEGDVFIADYANHRVERVSADGVLRYVFGTGNACSGDTVCGMGGAASLASVGLPLHLTVSASGEVYVTDEDGYVDWLAGPQRGPQGPPGAAARLVVVAYAARVRRGAATVSYALSADARLTLSVRPPKGHAATVATRTVRAGTGHMAWNGRLHGRRAAHGRYRLVLAAKAGTRGATSTITVRL